MTDTSPDTVSGSADRSAAEPVLYREWQRPWIPALFGTAVGGAFAGIPIGITVALGDPFNLASGIIIPSTSAFIAFVVLISARWIRLEPQVLRIGGKRIPLDAVTETRVLRGWELWRVRFRITMPSSKGSSLAGGVGIVADIGVPGAGYMWATRTIRNGNCCSPGQGPAVMLLTPSLGTPVWIVGSRHAADLKAAIDRACAALPQEGWLPTPHIR